MATDIQGDGETVHVTTREGHRIGFAMSELNAASTAGEITTEWAGGQAPNDPERIVREAKAEAEAEAYVARHHLSRPDAAREAKEDGKGFGGAVKDALGLP